MYYVEALKYSKYIPKSCQVCCAVVRVYSKLKQQVYGMGKLMLVPVVAMKRY